MSAGTTALPAPLSGCPGRAHWDADVLLSAEKRQCIYAFRLFIFQSRKIREENRLRLRNERGKKGISKVLWRKKEQPPPSLCSGFPEQPKCCDFRAPGLRAGRRRRSRTEACPVLLRCVHGTVRAAMLLIRLERGVSLFSAPPLCSSLCPLHGASALQAFALPLGGQQAGGPPGMAIPPLASQLGGSPCSALDLPAGRAVWSCCTSSLAEKINNLFNKAFYPLYILSLIKILHRQKVQKLV